MLDLPRDQPPQPTRLADYQPPDFLIDKVELEFFLAETGTTVTSHLQLRRNPDATDRGARVRLDPGDYRIEADGALVIETVPDAFILDIENRIHPENNTQLSGLYISGGNFCTQCEAEGFSRITWFLDRPDVMSPFTVTIRADKSRYPVLLSNGNPSGQGDL